MAAEYFDIQKLAEAAVRVFKKWDSRKAERKKVVIVFRALRLAGVKSREAARQTGLLVKRITDRGVEVLSSRTIYRYVKECKENKSADNP